MTAAVIASPASAPVRSATSWAPATRFLTATAISFYGDFLTTVALVVVLYRLTGSAAAPAGYWLARTAPRVLGSAPGGALADRFSPAPVAAACALVQSIVIIALVPMARLHLLWGVYLLVVLGGFLSSMARPCQSALIPRLAPPERLGRVNALYGMALSSCMFLAPATGAFLLARSGAELLLLLDALTFVISAGFLLTLSRAAPRSSTGAPPGGAAAGLPVVIQDPLLRTLAAVYLAGGIAATAVQSVLVVAAAQRFGGASTVGWLYAAVGAGALSGGVFLLRRQIARVTRSTILVAGLLELVPLVLFALTSILWLALALLAICGLGDTLSLTWGNTDLQRRVAPEVIGRVYAVLFFALYIGMLLGAVGAISLTPVLGWVNTLLLLSISSLMLPVAASIRWRALQAPSR